MPAVTFKNQCRFTAIRWNSDPDNFTLRVEDGNEETVVLDGLIAALPEDDFNTYAEFIAPQTTAIANQWVEINSPFHYCDARC